MNEQNDKYRLLLINQLRPEFTLDYMLVKGLRNYREVLLRDYPHMEKWLPKETFDLDPIWPERLQIKFRGYGVSTPGNFIKGNLKTPTDVMYGDITPGQVIEKLKEAKMQKFPYTHVGFSIFVTGYTNFIKTSRAVRNYDPNIITIAGNVGSLFPGTENYVDFVCRGDGVPYLREMFSENECNTPYNLEIIPAKSIISVNGLELKSDSAQIVTKLGCVNNCFTGALFTPNQVHDKLVEYRRKIKKDFSIMFCEPQGIVNKKWWYELFDLFNDEPEDYPVIVPTSLASIRNFDLDRVSRSSLRFMGLNIGIESFSQDYAKNAKHRETKAIIRRLTNYGIGVYGTFIIGFDLQTRESIWKEIQHVVDLDIFAITVHNLKVLPQTPLWYEFERHGRLLNVPYDFYYVEGFQPFTHPHFKPGFEDMLPLTYDIYEYIEKERGPQVLSLMELMSNVPNQRRTFKRQIKQYKLMSKQLFSSWKNHLNPSEDQITKYLRRLGEPLEFSTTVAEVL
ncbi:MAG: B12-binding domain-containing radical SAM protein [Candidatus Hodarchaeota archaeon]